MPLDLLEFGKNSCGVVGSNFKLYVPEVLSGTGIAEDRLRALEHVLATPSGDEVLIFADFFHCDYRLFVSNEKLAAFEQTDALYRRYGEDLFKADRLRLQEVLFVCESMLLQSYIDRHLPLHSVRAILQGSCSASGQFSKTTFRICRH